MLAFGAGGACPAGAGACAAPVDVQHASVIMPATTVRSNAVFIKSSSAKLISRWRPQVDGGSLLAGGHRGGQPLQPLVAVATQARVRTVFGAEARGHRRIGDLVNLMRSGLEDQGLGDARHMTADAAAGFGARGVASVPLGRVLEAGVALDAHPVVVFAELQGRRVGRRVRRMRIVARRTRGATSLEAPRPREGLADESGRAEPAVAIQRMARELV